MRRAGSILILVIFWCLIWGEFSPQNALVGFILSIPLIFGPFKLLPIDVLHPVRLYFILRYLLRLFYEIICANLKVFLLIINPRLKLRPGIIAFKGDVRGDVEVTMLSNSITLTPGTITVFTDEEALYIHVLNIDEPSGVRDKIRRGLEEYILGATRCLRR